jgi:hypothetical protein
VTDFHARDTLNFTDLTDSEVTAVFLDGVLIVSRRGNAGSADQSPWPDVRRCLCYGPNGEGGTLVSLAPTP